MDIFQHLTVDFTETTAQNWMEIEWHILHWKDTWADITHYKLTHLYGILMIIISKSTDVIDLKALRWILMSLYIPMIHENCNKN